MKRKGLYFLIALALGGVGAVHAQDTTAPATPADTTVSDTAISTYDGRWYIAPTVGGYYNDTDRNTNSRQIYYGLGFGKFINVPSARSTTAQQTVVVSQTGAGRTTPSVSPRASTWVTGTPGGRTRWLG